MRIALFALNLLAVSAFTVQPSHRPLSTALSMSAAVEEVPITVTGNNIDLTPPLVDYVNQKLERPLGKLRANGIIQDCAVHLIVNKNPKVSQRQSREQYLSVFSLMCQAHDMQCLCCTTACTTNTVEYWCQPNLTYCTAFYCCCTILILFCHHLNHVKPNFVPLPTQWQPLGQGLSSH